MATLRLVVGNEYVRKRLRPRLRPEPRQSIRIVDHTALSSAFYCGRDGPATGLCRRYGYLRLVDKEQTSALSTACFSKAGWVFFDYFLKIFWIKVSHPLDLNKLKTGTEGFRADRQFLVKESRRKRRSFPKVTYCDLGRAPCRASGT